MSDFEIGGFGANVRLHDSVRSARRSSFSVLHCLRQVHHQREMSTEDSTGTAAAGGPSLVIDKQVEFLLDGLGQIQEAENHTTLQVSVKPAGLGLAFSLIEKCM
ncbi:uncharacterized protein CLUP02_08638 [Colletotrichum lupini]|uniref:Uncharacterized protein n=1 Tax=Colletotrichum lupini TaxID=145971 RepID=A0A9Q8STH1_9PEZI|nr:uncharacterized protein CLUP02_08638 [Colletotrichum lupini]UQC83145.1 hypothetical protein CLUP02_08638 [Colletotrichum lupini]